MKKHKKNTCRETLQSKIFIFLILTLTLFIPLVSAADWDNIKSYDETQKQVTIYNWNIIGKLFNIKLAEYKLTKNTDYCLENCYAEGTAVLYAEEQLFSDLNFRDNKRELTNIKASQIYTEQEIEYEVDVPDYKEVCKIDEKNLSNVCTTEQIGTHKETKYKNEWKEYNGEVLIEGSYNWRIEGQKELRENIDWLGTAFGKEFNEWAWWSGNYSYCRNLKPSSTDARISEVIDVNITNGTDWAYISFLYTGTAQNYSVYFNNITDIRIVNTSCNDGGTEASFQIIDSSHTTLYNVTLYEYFEFGYGHSNGDDITDNTDWTGACPIDTFNNTISKRGTLSMYIDDQSGGVGLDYAVLTDSQKVLSFYFYDFDAVNYEWFGMADGADKGVWTFRTSTSATNMVYKNGAVYVDSGILKNASTFIPFKTIHNATGTHYYYTNGTTIVQTYVWAAGAPSPEHIAWDPYIRKNHVDSIVVTTGLDVNQYPVLTTFTLGGVETSPISVITLIEPVDYFNTTLDVDDFTFNITIPLGDWTNYTFTVWNSTNATVRERIVINGTPDTDCTETYQVNNIYVECIGQAINIDDTYHWNTYACMDTGVCFWATANFTFTIDTTPPVLSGLTNLTNLTTFSLPVNSTWNYTASDDNLDDCYYNTTENITYTFIPCNAADINTSWATAGSHTVYYCANDTFGFETCNSTEIFINYLQQNATYESPVIEAENTTLIMNLSATLISSFNGSLTWNATVYYPTVSYSSTEGNLTINLTMPTIPATVIVNFSWNYTINGINYTTIDYNQSIILLTPLNVSSAGCQNGLSAAMCWNFKDEGNLSNITSDIDYIFSFGVSNTTYKTVYGSMDNINETCLCINSTVYNNYTLGYGEIQYTTANYVDRRFYTFTTQRLTNTTINNTLYSLLSAAQTSFKLEVEDTSLNPYVEKYTTLVRWYPDLNQYNVVDMGKTDETGSTVIHVEAEDVDYRIGVYEQDGSLIKLAEPIRMVCLITPCTYTLRISPTDTDYTSFLNVDYNIGYNYTTGLWTFTWVDTTQETSSMNLTVFRVTGTSVYPVCSSLVTGYTGAVICDTSAYTGTLKAVVERTASPGVPIVTKIIQTTTTAFSSTFGLFLSLLIAIPIVFVFAIASPIGAIIGGVVSLIPALYFGAINWAIIGGIAVLAGIVLHFLKRVG